MSNNKNTFGSHFMKSIKEMGTQGKNLANKTQEMGTNFTKLPWKKLPVIGWFYIFLILTIIILFGVFVAPAIALY